MTAEERDRRARIVNHAMTLFYRRGHPLAKRREISPGVYTARCYDCDATIEVHTNQDPPLIKGANHRTTCPGRRKVKPDGRNDDGNHENSEDR